MGTEKTKLAAQVLKLLGGVQQRANPAMNATFSSQAMTGGARAFAPTNRVLEQAERLTKPGTYIDAAAEGYPVPLTIGAKALKGKYDKYSDMVDSVTDEFDPTSNLRDLFHAAYDPSGKWSRESRMVANVAQPFVNTVNGLAKFPVPGAAGFILGANALGQGLQYETENYNLPGLNNPFLMKHRVYHGGEEPYTDEDREYNRQIDEHNKHVNDWFDRSDMVWNTAQQRARQLADITSGIVREGKRIGLSEKQIQSRIKAAKAKFGPTGGAILATHMQGDTERLIPVKRTLKQELAAATIIDPRAKTNYDYNAWDRR